MLENLHLLAYNNYYNRQVKRESAYLSYQEYELFTNNSVNFNPNDHINTVVKVTLNHLSLATPNLTVDEAIEQLNYIVVTDETNSIINSRWFIIDSKREGTTSWHVSLRRDVVADNYHSILDAPVFIEKGTPSADNPLLFNRENMSYNQIKQGEWLLKDRTRCPWLVGYYSKKIDEGSDNALTGTVKQDNTNFITLPVETIDAWKYYKYRTETGDLFYSPATNFSLHLYFNTYVDAGYRKLNVNINRNNRDYSSYLQLKDVDSGNSTVGRYSDSQPGVIANAILTDNYFRGWDNALVAEGAQGTYEDYQDFFSYNNKLVQTGNGKVYEIQITRANVDSKLTKINPVGSLARDYIKPLLEKIPEVITLSPNENSYTVTTALNAYQLILLERSNTEITYDISGGRKCEDEVYNLFAIPYGEVTLQGTQTTTINNPALALDLARTIQRNGGSNIYDVQLLPFCPCRDLLLEDGSIKLSEGAYSMVGSQMVILYPLFANFSISELIIEGEGWDTVPQYGNVETQKIIAECDEIRLVSPNYNGQFSFNAARNSGIPGFTADCTYKPYSPYIHVNPIFGGLYGRDFNDARGLICQGDFSISSVSDAWTQYEINNKNYNNIFSREIQTMEKSNNIQAHLDVANAISGTISGAAAGGAAGSLMGVNPLKGAAAGGIASLIGGAADITFNAMLRNEQLELKRDMYGYQLGNIQALPYSLSKVSALNENNKLFPFVEYYTCTEKEKQALRNKLKYNGYTIMAIDNIPNYSPVNVETYIKGRIIRFDDQIESHTAYAINDELQSGLFIKRNDSEV